MQIIDIDKSNVSISSTEPMKRILLTQNSKTPFSHIDIKVKTNHSLELYILCDSQNSVKQNIEYSLERDSSLVVNTLDIDSVSVDREQLFNLNGENINVKAYGLYITALKEYCNNTIRMNHHYPNCHSEQLYKGVVGHKAKFNGHIYIAKDAQHSKAVQQNHNILLSDDAMVSTQPFLEIYADDVKCNHGATVGKNDPEAIYYMRQRGISTDDAKNIMLEAFIKQCVLLDDDEIMERIAAKLKTITV